MKKAILMTDGNKLYNVYPENILNLIKQKVSLFGTVINSKNINEYKEEIKQAELIFTTWGMLSFTEEEIANLMPNLKMIFYAAGSVKYFAQPFINKGIKVISAWQANSIPTAEFAATQIVLANKGFYQSQLLVKKTSYYSALHFNDFYPGNYGVKVGLLGAGMVGSHVIKILNGMGVNVDILVYDPFLSEERAKFLDVKKTDLETIFSTCQTISNHLANVEQTQKMITRAHFEKMLPYATFINTGRGQQIVEEDLINALKEVPTRTAVLDVTFPEPPLPDSELLNMDNVFLTPHIAGSKGNELARMSQYMVEELIRWMNGENLKYNVSLEMLTTMA
ncbi:MAG: D-isomer specific 2-hydroxyacid dehydrogenase NAD-binding protein [Haloplasmataceae bacterium]|jgi:phosphoglycerate dehydrogenase-like enzyme|nr:D-isomer specific 2-hydroxyacid dehydrogenase NAD-binding protein [Haloplasmataceae bacterium]